LTDEVRKLKKAYQPRNFYEQNGELKRVLDMIGNGAFSPNEPELFRPIVDSLLSHDEYLLLADYDAYIKCQDEVSKAYRDPTTWTKKSILNVAQMGKFSTDRTIKEYASNIWGVKPVAP
ncbi:MAG TPA: glycogen/starch/alpha-glucan phosphorylase, partial [Myxococcota bacterium]